MKKPRPSRNAPVAANLKAVDEALRVVDVLQSKIARLRAAITEGNRQKQGGRVATSRRKPAAPRGRK